MNTDKVPDTKLKGIKLIVADLDGTLLKSDKSLDDNIKDVISGQDYKFTIASGRSMILGQKYDMVTMLIVTDPNEKEISFIDCQEVKKGQIISK